MTTRRSRTWFVGFGLLGTMAGLAGGYLVWLVLTQPLAIASVLAGGLR